MTKDHCPRINSRGFPRSLVKAKLLTSWPSRAISSLWQRAFPPAAALLGLSDLLLRFPHVLFIPQRDGRCFNFENLQWPEHLANLNRFRIPCLHSAASMSHILPRESVSSAWPAYGDAASVIRRKQGPTAQAVSAPESVTAHRL